MNKFLTYDFNITYNDSKYFDYSFLMNKTILFTGAAGLIGQYFVKYLLFLNDKCNLNIKMIAFDISKSVLDDAFSDCSFRNDIILINGDVSDNLEINQKIDFIIHAASPANPYWFSNYPVEVIKANIFGTYNLLNVALKNNSKFLYISSGEIYGMEKPNNIGYLETQMGSVDCQLTRSCYTESKRCAETLVNSFSFENNMNCLSVRLCYIYGPTYSSNEKRVVFQFLNNFINNENIVMKSQGKQIRSYCYVSDAVLGILQLLKNGKKQNVYNLAYKNSIHSIKEIADCLVEISKNRLQIVLDIPSENEKNGYSKFPNAVQNSDKLISLGWHPSVDLKSGLKRTIRAKKGLNNGNQI